jgi:hypothetical protein
VGAVAAASEQALAYKALACSRALPAGHGWGLLCSAYDYMSEHKSAHGPGLGWSPHVLAGHVGCVHVGCVHVGCVHVGCVHVGCVHASIKEHSGMASRSPRGPASSTTTSCQHLATSAPNKQPAVDNGLVYLARRLQHDVPIRAVEAQRGGGQPVRDQVDPQQLHRREHLGDAQQRGDEDGDDLAWAGRWGRGGGCG